MSFFCVDLLYYFFFGILCLLSYLYSFCCSFIIIELIFGHICVVLLSYFVCSFVLFDFFFVIFRVVLSSYFCSGAALSWNRKDTMGANIDKLCGTFNIIISIAFIIIIIFIHIIIIKICLTNYVKKQTIHNMISSTTVIIANYGHYHFMASD